LAKNTRNPIFNFVNSAKHRNPLWQKDYIMNYKYLILATLLMVLSALSLRAQGVGTSLSGDVELDSIREVVKRIPTNRSNFQLRAFKMKLWVVTLQQQGARLETYLPIDEGLRKVVFWNTLHQDGKPQQFSDADIAHLSEVVDKGYAILEKIQNTIPEKISAKAAKTPSVFSPKNATNWTHYKGNAGLTGYSGASGPTAGVKDWKFPIGLAWEVAPVVEGNQVLLTAPGMRTILYSVDLETGKENWRTNQVAEIMGDQLYNTPCYASTPIVVKDDILLREMGSRGNKGPNKDIIFIDKKTGAVKRKFLAGHVDYRVGYAPLAANEQFTIIPHGVQDIEETPVTSQPFNRIVCAQTQTGKRLWDFNIGATFAEPFLDGNLIFVGTQAGYLYALKADGKYSEVSAERIAWQFKAQDAINRKVTVVGNYVYFGANDGVFYCLEKQTGKRVWQAQTPTEKRAFRLFSTPSVSDGIVAVGSANEHLYAFDAASGKPIFDVKLDDWVRSRPIVAKGKVYAATLSGTLFCVASAERKPRIVFKKKISEHAILADLTYYQNKILINDSDLYTHCLDENGREIWKKSLLDGFEKQGNRILADQIAGGAYYQSKPTVADNTVFFGAPNRFVYAVDAQTGTEKWKFEMGASVSVAPVYDKGQIFAGQQGGEDAFYCLDAQTGQPKWTQTVGWVWGSANVSDGMVFIPGIDGYANALDAKTGAIVWRYRLDRSVCSEPTVDSTQVFFGSWDHFLYAFDKKTGRVNWKYQLSGGTDSGVAIYENGRIYLPLGGNVFRCLDAKTGELLWKYEEKGSVFNVTPAVHNGRVFVSCWHGLGLGGICVEAVVICLDANTGKVIWKHIGGGLSGPVVGIENKVYFPSIADPYFYCVDAVGNGDGTTTCHWMYQMGNKVEESTAALYGNRAYIMSSDGFIHAIR
jgi:outer membrane protein assembly factor BamB